MKVEKKDIPKSQFIRFLYAGLFYLMLFGPAIILQNAHSMKFQYNFRYKFTAVREK
jgi:hypothetical protein